MKPPAECGTYAGYQRHFRKHETPCEPCRDANTAYNRAYNTRPENRGRNLLRAKAQGLAEGELARRHHDEYTSLYRAFVAALSAESGGAA